MQKYNIRFAYKINVCIHAETLERLEAEQAKSYNTSLQCSIASRATLAHRAQLGGRNSGAVLALHET